LPSNAAFLQEAPPQVIQIGRQVQLIQEPVNFVQIQAADVLCPAIHEHLPDVPAPFKGIVKVHRVGAPYNGGRRFDPGHT
jgi:hypothetical protein